MSYFLSPAEVPPTQTKAQREKNNSRGPTGGGQAVATAGDDQPRRPAWLIGRVWEKVYKPSKPTLTEFERLKHITVVVVSKRIRAENPQDKPLVAYCEWCEATSQAVLDRHR